MPFVRLHQVAAILSKQSNAALQLAALHKQDRPQGRSAPDVLLQQGPQPQPGVRSVLLVGNPSLQLKGFDVAIAVLAAVNQVVPLHITWVCQTQPTAALVPALLASGLRIHLHVNPSQVSRLSALGAMPCPALQ